MSWLSMPYVSAFAAFVLFVLVLYFCFAAFLTGPSEREFFRRVAGLSLDAPAGLTGLVKLHGELHAGADGERTSLLTGLPTVWAQLDGGFQHSEDGPLVSESHGSQLWLREGAGGRCVAVRIDHKPAAYKTDRLISRDLVASGPALPTAMKDRLLEQAGASGRFLVKAHLAADLTCSEMFFAPGDAVFVIGRVEQGPQQDGSDLTIRVDLSTDGAVFLAGRDEYPWQTKLENVERRIRQQTVAAAVSGISLGALVIAILVFGG